MNHGTAGTIPGVRLLAAVLLGLPLLVLVLVLAGLERAYAATGIAPQSPVTVIGVPNLRAGDLDPTATPVLWGLLREGAAANISTKAAASSTCPADGWAVLGAGQRVAGTNPPSGACSQRVAVAPPRAATLAELVQAAGGCVRVVGARAEAVAPAPTRGGPSCPLTLVDAGDERAAEAAVRAAPSGVTVLVVGVSDGPEGPPAVHLALARGPGFAPGSWLRSSSTRHAGLVVLSDLPAVVLHALGLPPSDRVLPARWTTEPAPAPAVVAATLADFDRLTTVARAVTIPFYVVLLVVEVTAYAVVLGIVGRLHRVPERLRRATRGLALFFGAFVPSTYLAQVVPWWRVHPPLPALLAVTAAVAAGLTALALAGPWRREPLGPAGVVAGAFVVVLTVDVLAGGDLLLAAITGNTPLDGGRYYGFGNIAFGIYATCALLTAAALADPALRQGQHRQAAALVLGVGLGAVVVDGTPGLGTDVGGVLALLPVVVVLALRYAGIALRPLRLAAAATSGLVLVSLLAVVDYTRPPATRTHLGEFVGQLREGTAGATILRKAQANVDLLVANAGTLLIPFLTVGAAVLLLAPQRVRAFRLALAYERAPALQPVLVALLANALLGWVVNDSGTVVPAFTLLVGVPLAIATACNVLPPSRQPAPAHARAPVLTPRG